MIRQILCVILATSTVGSAFAGVVEDSGVKGGLVVHLGCGDGKETARLRINDSYIVHGLDIDAKGVKDARTHIRSLGIYGKVTADTFDGKNLPYIDNLVNLLVDESGTFKVPGDEIIRVLAPGGVAIIKGKKTVKPVPGEID